MKNIKKIVMLTTVIITSLFSYQSLQAKKIKPEERVSYLSDEDIKKIDASTWKVNINSSVKNTYFGALQFTIFETDPMPLLIEQKKISDKVNKGKDLTKLDKIIDMSTSWDLIFMEKTGVDIYLIKENTKKKDGVIVSASTKGDKKWLVTKSVQNKDGSISAWIIPFDSQIGKTAYINITDKNKFDFTTMWK